MIHTFCLAQSIWCCGRGEIHCLKTTPLQVLCAADGKHSNIIHITQLYFSVLVAHILAVLFKIK